MPIGTTPLINDPNLRLVLSVPGLFLVQVVFGLALYFGLSSLWYAYVFRWRKHALLPSEPPPDPAENRRAMKLAVWNVLGNAALGTPFQYWIFHGRGRLYYRIADRGWAYYVLSALAFLIVTELLVYWAHRSLHHRALYKHLHVFHHQFREPTPWVSMAFHPLDSWMQALPYYLCALFLPVHVSIYAVMFAFVMLWTFMIHDRVSLVRSPLVHYTAHHSIHHAYNKHNFGQFLTVFDRVFGTHKDPAKETRFAVLHPGPLARSTSARG